VLFSSINKFEHLERSVNVTGNEDLLSRSTEAGVDSVVGLEGPDHALGLGPGAVLEEAHLVRSCGEQVTTEGVECDVVHSYAGVTDVRELEGLVQAINAANIEVLPGCSQIGSLVREDELLNFSRGRSLEFHSHLLVSDIVDLDRTRLESECHNETIWVKLDLRDRGFLLELGEADTLLHVVECPGAVGRCGDHIVIQRLE